MGVTQELTSSATHSCFASSFDSMRKDEHNKRNKRKEQKIVNHGMERKKKGDQQSTPQTNNSIKKREYNRHTLQISHAANVGTAALA